MKFTELEQVIAELRAEITTLETRVKVLEDGCKFLNESYTPFWGLKTMNNIWCKLFHKIYHVSIKTQRFQFFYTYVDKVYYRCNRCNHRWTKLIYEKRC